MVDQLRTAEPDLINYLHSALSTDVLDVLAPTAAPPGRAASTRPEVPTELSDAEIGRALRNLTG